MTRRWKKLAVFTLGVCVINCGALKWATAQGNALLSESALKWGRELSTASTLLTHLNTGDLSVGIRKAHILGVNGATIRIQSGSVTQKGQSIMTLVERAKENCRTPELSEPGGDAPLLESPIFSGETEDEAFVYCLKPEKNWQVDSLRELWARYEVSRDLTEFGVFQGAYFHKSGDSIAILSAEVIEGLNPAAMFPANDGPAGPPLTDLPTPAGRRLLAISLGDRPALTVHASSHSSIKSLDDYHLVLIERGFSVQRAQAKDHAAPALLARSPRDSFMITSLPTKDGSQMTIARLPH